MSLQLKGRNGYNTLSVSQMIEEAKRYGAKLLDDLRIIGNSKEDVANEIALLNEQAGTDFWLGSPIERETRDHTSTYWVSFPTKGTSLADADKGEIKTLASFLVR